MTSMTEQPFVMFASHSDSPDEFAQAVFSTSGPMDVPIPADAFANFQHQDVYPTSMGYEPALFAEATPNYMLNNRSSPGMYDESDMRLPSSSMSTASVPSAASSNIGSPQSNHGHMGAGSEWVPQGLSAQPAIVGDSYMPGNDFPFGGPGMEEFATFDYGTAKAYVGELDASTSLVDVTATAATAPPRGPAAQQRPPRHSPKPPYPCLPALPISSSSASTSNGASTFSVANDRFTPEHQFSRSFSCGSSSSASPLSIAPLSPSIASKRRLSTPAISSTETPHWPSHPTRKHPVSPVRNRRDAAFFSQSSGHFVYPLDSWPSSRNSPVSTISATSPTMLADLAFATDPSLIHPEIARPPMGMPTYDAHFQQPTHYPASPSVASSSPQPNMMRTNSSSPFLHSGSFQQPYPSSPYGAPMDHHPRAPSMGHFVPATPNDYHSGDEKEKQRCTWPDCGKTFKDLKAHMLTHQNERPEKCPIQTCEYHIKGFARKYDKNRHTLTHYKGTMVCGFCPGSGSAAEKSFNRADVFKRHLTAVHGVEQTPPNSRKKSAAGNKKVSGYASDDATGKCSTCSQTFSNAQDFYEHLDDCVLRIVQQEDPAEAINAKRLAEVENDKDVHQTLEKNNLPITTEMTSMDEDDEELDTGDEDEADASSKSSQSPATKKKGNPANGVQKSRGMTHSRGGGSLPTKTRNRKNRRDYPSSWGFDKGQMTMKKRVLAVFDGPRRLAKDEMMLSTDHEVRVKLSDGKSYVTDLDIKTIDRANGFHSATEEEKGPWISDDPSFEQLKEMQMMLDSNSAI